MEMTNRIKAIEAHYNRAWKSEPNVILFDKGPIHKLSPNFRVLVYGPTLYRNMWCYATCDMGIGRNSDQHIELHIFSAKQDYSLVELLTSAAYYHKKNCEIGLNDTVFFGKSWQDNSICSYGLISLPYLDGPDLENYVLGNQSMKFYWLIPITNEELEYKKKYGAEALEDMFEKSGLEYFNPNRKSII